MAAQKGKLLLLAVGNADGPPETFTTLAGLRPTSFSINNEAVDITNKDSSGYRELLDGAGITNFSLSGGGVFKDDASYTTAETYARLNQLQTFQITVPDFATYTGEFLITQLEIAGDYNGEANYNVSLESSGAMTFAAI